MRISIFGLGYIGSVSAACLSSLGHEVIGVDINPMKVEMINAGQSPVIEAGVDELIQAGTQKGCLRATGSSLEAIQASDVSLVCVGTPSAENGDLNLGYVKRVVQEIGQALAQKQSFHVIIMRSTMLPGSMVKHVIPILEHSSGRKAGLDFGLVFNPEFLREGSAVKDFFHPPFTLIGQYDEKSAQIATSIYSGIQAPLRLLPLEAAEMIKYACNTFHALKVTFANEIGTICKELGIDSHQVMDVFCLDTQLNISPYYLNPGFAFGGSCLPKDLRALLYLSNHLDQRVPVLSAVMESNDLHIRRGIEMVRQTGSKKIGFLGLSCKAGTDDLRESPLVEMIETLAGKGYQIQIYDRNVTLARLYGANRAFIEREIPHIAQLMCSSIDDVLAASEVIVVGNKAPEFVHALQKTRPGQIVIDLVRILDDDKTIPAEYRGLCW